MTLTVVLASLVLEHFFGHWQRLRRLSWFMSYRKRLLRLLPEPWHPGYRGVLLLLVIPASLIALLQWLLQGYAWGALELIYSVLIVSYCLGPEAFNERVDAYITASEEHHRVDAKELAESLVGEPVSDNQQNQTRAVAMAVLYEGNIRIFAILFWFMLLGPAGALLYRCAAFLVEDSNNPTRQHLLPMAERAFAVLDWLPANMLSLTFFLTGSFDDALAAWKKALRAELEFNERNRSTVIHTGCGAMRHEVDDAFGSTNQGEKYDLYWVRTARSLVMRSLVVWLAGIAILTMAGWFI